MKPVNNKRILYLALIAGLFFIFTYTTPSSEAHVLIVADDGGNENPDWLIEANNTAQALDSKGYQVLELAGDNATGKNIMKGMYNADALIYIGHGGYMTGHYDNNGGKASPPFALVGSDEFIWGIDGKIREGWNGPVITAPFKSNIPVILSHACFSTGYVGSQEVANPLETIYNFSHMFTGAGANYYATGYYGSYNGKTVVDLVDEFLSGATTFQAANDQNNVRITSYSTYNNTKIWSYSQGYAAFVGDWSATFPTASQTTPYNDAAAEAWYQSIITGNIDLTSPIIISTSPKNSATTASITSPVTITFSENIQEGANFADIYLKNMKTNEKVALNSLTINGATLTIKPSLKLISNTNYKLYIPIGAIKDLNGNLFMSNYTLSFKTTVPDTTPPKVSSTNPKNNTTGFSLTSSVVITFSENIKAGTNYAGIYFKNLTTGKKVSFTKTISGKTLTLKMTLNRLRNNLYQIYIPAGAVKDLHNNSLKSSYTLQFRTVK